MDPFTCYATDTWTTLLPLYQKLYKTLPLYLPVLCPTGTWEKLGIDQPKAQGSYEFPYSLQIAFCRKNGESIEPIATGTLEGSKNTLNLTNLQVMHPKYLIEHREIIRNFDIFCGTQYPKWKYWNVSLPLISKLYEDGSLRKVVEWPDVNVTNITYGADVDEVSLSDTATSLDNPYDLKMMEILSTDIPYLPENLLDFIAEALNVTIANYSHFKAYLGIWISDPRNHLMIFSLDTSPVGILRYTRAVAGPVQLLDFYLHEDIRHQGIGTWIFQQFLGDIYGTIQHGSLISTDLHSHDVERQSFYGHQGLRPKMACLSRKIHYYDV